MIRLNTSDSPSFWLVADDKDTFDTYAQIRGLARLSPGNSVVVADLHAASLTLSHIGHQIVEALQKESGRSGEVRSALNNWAFVRAWFVGLGVNRLVLNRAHLLQPRLLQEIVGLACWCGCELVLIYHPRYVPRALRAVLPGLDFKKEDLSTWLTH